MPASGRCASVARWMSNSTGHHGVTLAQSCRKPCVIWPWPSAELWMSAHPLEYRKGRVGKREIDDSSWGSSAELGKQQQREADTRIIQLASC